MHSMIQLILPVFLVIVAGYLATWRGLFSDSAVDGMMKFAQNFAVPCLLFRAIAGLDIGQEFDLALLFSFYLGATIAFLGGLFGARYIFKRPWLDCIAIGFCSLFSNTILLGLPITERAFGVDALKFNYAIIAFHSPFCYAVGITVMEVARNRGGRPSETARKVLNAMFRNALVIGIALGFIVNFGNVPLPGALTQALDLIIQAALPIALFGLGGVLVRFRPEGDVRTILWVCLLSLVLHPAIAYFTGKALNLSTEQLRAAVILASMAPGMNTYLFANMYNSAKRVAASGVLIGTALSIITIPLWLAILP